MPVKKKSINGEILHEGEGAVKNPKRDINVTAQPQGDKPASTKKRNPAKPSLQGKGKEAASIIAQPVGGKDEQGIRERYLRLRAEFDNYIKRTNREKSELLEYAGDGIVRRILPILDDLRRTIEHARQNGTPEKDPILEGVLMVQEKFIKTLESEGVYEIAAVGQPFDPELHEALQARDSADNPSGIVIEEFEPGYLYRDRVVRHSKVIVSS